MQCASREMLAGSGNRVSSSSHESSVGSSTSFFELLFSSAGTSGVPSGPAVIEPFSFTFFSGTVSVA